MKRGRNLWKADPLERHPRRIPRARLFDHRPLAGCRSLLREASAGASV